MNCTNSSGVPCSAPTQPMFQRCLASLLPAFVAIPLGAVYAPVPEEELGQPITVTLEGGVFHDSNIFGAPSGEIDSLVWRAAPSVELALSLSDQTFFSAGYGLTYDYIADRPQNRDLFSHDLHARLAHAFNPRSTLDLNNTFLIAENPESLLAGVPLNTDQSYRSNQFDATYTGGLTERLGFAFKGRSLIFNYDLASLADQLDRSETLLGVSVDYAVSEVSKALGELRFLDVSYDTLGNRKDKQSVYYLGGFDYAPSEQTAFNLRLGWEQRYRWGAPDDDAPYAEITGRYAYGKQSFVSAGYIHTREESSNPGLYTDVEVNRFFANVQHALGASTFGSVFYNIEPSTLNGRPGASPDRDETTQRAGAALTFRPRPNWSVIGTFDYDLTQSDDPTRDLERTRIGLELRYAFGLQL